MAGSNATAGFRPPSSPGVGITPRAAALLLVGALALLVSLSTSHRISAQEPGSLRTDIVGVEDGDYPNAQAVVNIDDPSGGDLAGLTASTFTATLDGKPASIVSAHLASSQNLPLDLLFVVDTSGSMAGAPLARTKEAAIGFLDGLAPLDRVAVIRFADDVELALDYTSDRDQARAAINGLTASGNTALYQATANTAIKLSTSGASRRAVIFLSDGAQDGVPLTIARDAALAAASGIGVPFFTIGEGKSIDRDYLRQLADATRGRYLEAPDPKDLADLYASVGRILRSQYIVTFDASLASNTGSELAITLRTGSGATTSKTTYKPGTGFGPTGITIDGLAAGESVRQTRTVTVVVPNAVANLRASFYVDDVNVFESVDPPYRFDFDPAKYSDGDHRLRVSVQSGARKASEASVAFSSVAPPPVSPSGGGSSTLLVGAGIGVGLLLAIGVFVGSRFRAARRGDAPDLDRVVSVGKPMLTRGSPTAEAPEPEPEVVESPGEPLGVLILREGKALGSEYNVGASPVSIGSGSRCGVRVDDPDMAAEEARTWVRKGHLMVHKMTRLTTLVADGTSGGWQILQPGDTFTVGAHTFEFRLLSQPEGEPTPPAAADARPAPTAAADQRHSPFTGLMPRND